MMTSDISWIKWILCFCLGLICQSLLLGAFKFMLSSGLWFAGRILGSVDETEPMRGERFCLGIFSNCAKVSMIDCIVDGWKDSMSLLVFCAQSVTILEGTNWKALQMSRPGQIRFFNILFWLFAWSRGICCRSSWGADVVGNCSSWEVLVCGAVIIDYSSVGAENPSCSFVWGAILIDIFWHAHSHSAWSIRFCQSYAAPVVTFAMHHVTVIFLQSCKLFDVPGNFRLSCFLLEDGGSRLLMWSWGFVFSLLE